MGTGDEAIRNPQSAIRNEGVPSATFALKQAQTRVRTLTTGEAQSWLLDLRSRQTEAAAVSLIEAEIARLEPFSPESTPYADPYFWAGVVVLGAGA